MTKFCRFLTLFALCWFDITANISNAAGARSFSTLDVAAWRKLLSDPNAPLVGVRGIEAADVLVDKLASLNPEIRDVLAYETIAFWVHGKQAPDNATMIYLFNRLMPQTMIALGASEDDRTFQRSFATLTLKEVVAADLTRRFLNADQISALATHVVTQLQAENDWRGYVANKGWAHTRAHQADLVRILARHSLLSDAQHLDVLNAQLGVVARATSGWRWGEDARIAAAITWLLQRDSGNLNAMLAVDAWTDRVLKMRDEFWRGRYNDEAYLRLRAQISVMTHVATRLSHPTSKSHTNATAKKLIEAVQRLQ